MNKGYNNKNNNQGGDIVFSKAIKAGKRVYYLDVKKNRKDELFLVITESKKIASEGSEQSPAFEKHKIFLYKEDFDKFIEGLNQTLEYIVENNTVDFVPKKKKESYQPENNTETPEEVSEKEDAFKFFDDEIKLEIDF